MQQVEERLHSFALPGQHWIPPHTYIVRADGDGMTEAGIRHNDLLLVDRSELAAEGEIVVAELNGEAFIRRLAIIDGTFALLSASDGFPPIRIGEGDEMTIWGVVRQRLSGEGVGRQK